MTYYLLGGGVVAIWAILLVMAGERQRRTNEIEIQQQVNEANALAATKRKMPPQKKAA
jgi:hypothetical protein